MSSAAISISPLDRELLSQIACGDERAFDQLYHLYHRPVYYYALSLIKEPAIAEEILQEVFLAVWRGADRFRHQAQVKTWLLRIAHYQAVGWLRRHNTTTTLEEIENLPDDTPIEESFWQADLERVRAALAKLTLKQRAVVELAFVYDLSYAEIAEVMAVPIGTVKSRMSYALRRLGQLVEPEQSDIVEPDHVQA
jgi:RNA polymerase sigma-70 factor (ECF subfamily)